MSFDGHSNETYSEFNEVISSFYKMQMEVGKLSFVFYTEESPSTPQVAIFPEDIPNNIVKVDVNLSIFDDNLGELEKKYSLCLMGSDIQVSDSDYKYVDVAELKEALDKIYKLHMGEVSSLSKRLSMYEEVYDQNNLNFLLVKYGNEVLSEKNIPEAYYDGIYTFVIPVVVPTPDGFVLNNIYYSILKGSKLEHDEKLHKSFPNDNIYATYDSRSGYINGIYTDNDIIYKSQAGQYYTVPLHNKIRMFCNNEELMKNIFVNLTEITQATQNILKVKLSRLGKN